MSRSRWMTRSIEEAKTLRTTRSGIFSPAIKAALTRASRASGAELAWMVQARPHPALTARVELESFSSPHLADHYQIGSHRKCHI